MTSICPSTRPANLWLLPAVVMLQHFLAADRAINRALKLIVMFLTKSFAPLRLSANHADCRFFVKRWVTVYCRKREIFWSIIVPDSIQMVHQLPRLQMSPKLYFHHNTMLQYITRFLNMWVTPVFHQHITTPFDYATSIIAKLFRMIFAPFLPTRSAPWIFPWSIALTAFPAFHAFVSGGHECTMT